jgi:hypothetical protein
MNAVPLHDSTDNSPEPTRLNFAQKSLKMSACQEQGLNLAPRSIGIADADAK